MIDHLFLFISFPEIPNSVRWLGAILAAIAAIITAYKFFLQRPSLQLLVNDNNQDFVFDNQVQSYPSFEIANRGNAPAHDVYLEIETPTWNFGEEQKGDTLTIEVSIGDDTDRSEDRGGSETDSTSQDSERSNGNLSLAGSALDVDHNFTTYFGRPGEINQMFINDTIYDGAKFRLFTTTLKLERFRTYEMKYRVGCQTYGPRTGTIKFDVGYDSIQVKQDPPRFWKAWSEKLKSPLRWISVDPYAWVRRVEIEKDQIGFFCHLFRPVAEVQVVGDPEKYYSVDIKATIFLDEQTPESTIGTVTFQEYGVSGREIVETRSKNGKSYRLPNVRFESQYWNLKQLPFLLSPKLPPFEMHISSRIDVDWCVELSPTDIGDFRGISVQEDQMSGGDQPHSGHVSVRVSGKVINENNQFRGVFLIVKFYANNGNVISTQYTEIGVGAGEYTEFHVGPKVTREQERRIHDYDILLQRSI